MSRWKLKLATGATVVAVSSIGFYLSPASGAVAQPPSSPRPVRTHSASKVHPKQGVGSCTLIGWNPKTDPKNAKNLPLGHRHQTYKPDNYNCTGAVFSKPGVQFRKFPQPKKFMITKAKSRAPELVRACRAGACTEHVKHALASTAAINPTAPFFPPFTHFVILVRENHTFDDYLGDCATTIQAGCKGVVQSTNHISSVPNLHTLAKTYALSDTYSTGTQPPSGPNHWYLFSGQSASSSQQQSYPVATGTEFDRFLTSTTGPSDDGTNPCTAQTGTGTGPGPVTFMAAGDFYWMLNSGSGYWRDPGTGKLEVLPVDRPGTLIPEEINYNEFTCNNQNIPDQTVANNYMNFVSANGLPAYNYVELFNDHPGTFQDIPTNDSVTNQIVNFIMSNPSYKDNTLIAIVEDDTQNGNNGSDHVSNTFRVPLVLVASPLYMKQHYVSHVAYTTANVLAAMERVMQNDHPGIISPTDSLGLSSFPMTSADQAALADPLEDFWIQGTTPLSATASGNPATGNAPLPVSFTSAAQGGTAPYSFSWNFGDGSAVSTAQNPSHTYAAAGTFNATVTVTDSASPPSTTTAVVTTKVNAVGNPLAATASAVPTSGQVPVNVAFTGTGTGGTPPYSFSWNFGDGSATSTAQNPSHTYNTAGNFTATLTVTDSASPVHTATATVPISVTPLQGAPPGAPTGLSAGAGNGQITLNWTAPVSDGGEQISSYRVYRGTSSGSETLLTTGGCANLTAVLTCTDTGLTNGQTYFYKVTAVNALAEGPQSNEASATPTSPGCTPTQLLGNPGFETGTAAPWSAGTGVISNHTQEPPHTGKWDAWLDGYGKTHTDTLSQTVTLPTGCSNYNLSFWLHIDTAETSTTTVFDTLKVQVLNSAGTVLATLHTYSNLDHLTGYAQHTFSLSPYAGQKITLKFTGAEDFELQTSFVIDDTAINTS
jgi:PKD repeat protein